MQYTDNIAIEELGTSLVSAGLYEYIKARIHDAVVYERKWGELVETTAARITQGLDSGSDPVAPPHYTKGSMQVIEAMQALMTPEEFRGHLKGCVFKYLFRYQHKGQKKADLQKMLTYGTWLKQFETDGHITILPAPEKPWVSPATKGPTFGAKGEQGI